MPAPTPLLIAVDGPAASGKGTIAAALAEHYGFAYLDTGLLYRAVGFLARRDGMSADNPATVAQWLRPLLAEIPPLLSNPALRQHEVGVIASQMAALPEVRQQLLDYQRDFCAIPPDDKPGAVLDGRDIGTVIAPGAQAKLFITASAEVRAQRRAKQLKNMGENIDDAKVLADILARDARDAGRASAPLKQADDAQVIDTTHLDVVQSIAAAKAAVKTRLGR